MNDDCTLSHSLPLSTLSQRCPKSKHDLPSFARRLCVSGHDVASIYCSPLGGISTHLSSRCRPREKEPKQRTWCGRRISHYRSREWMRRGGSSGSRPSSPAQAGRSGRLQQPRLKVNAGTLFLLLLRLQLHSRRSRRKPRLFFSRGGGRHFFVFFVHI